MVLLGVWGYLESRKGVVSDRRKTGNTCIRKRLSQRAQIAAHAGSGGAAFPLRQPMHILHG
jgi:hypothetical protein